MQFWLYSCRLPDLSGSDPGIASSLKVSCKHRRPCKRVYPVKNPPTLLPLQRPDCVMHMQRRDTWHFQPSSIAAAAIFVVTACFCSDSGLEAMQDYMRGLDIEV